jgi:hypothetical protein
MVSFSSLSFTSSFMAASIRSAHSRSTAAVLLAAAAFCRFVGELTGPALIEEQERTLITREAS